MRLLQLPAVAFAWMVLSGCEATDPDPGVALGRRLMVSENASCALNASGLVFCWGGNTAFFEFGVAPATTPGAPAPIAATAIPQLFALAEGVGTHLCGLRADSSAFCWGRGTFGQLGGGVSGNVGNAPAPVVGGIAWKQLALSRLSTCGVGSDDLGYCWGTNQRGEIGVDTVAIGALTTRPRRVRNGDLAFKSIAAGWLHACGITTTNLTFCWGDNRAGQLGNSAADTAVHRIPTLVAGGLSFVQLSLSARHSCGIATDGFAYCWGYNEFGQLGDGTTTQRNAPTRVAGDIKFRTVATGSGFAGASVGAPPVPALAGGIAHSCGLTQSGAPFCWGWNGNGQLGDGSVTNRPSPVAVTGGLTLETIGLGGSYTCGMRGSAVWCWGSNAFGQLGDGTFIPRPTPVQVLAPFDKP